MIRVYRNNTPYIICETNVFNKNNICCTTNSIINEYYIQHISRNVDDNSTLILLEGGMIVNTIDNYDNFIIEFFRPDPTTICKKIEHKNKIGF